MFPLHIAGLALAGRTLLDKYSRNPQLSKKTFRFKFPQFPTRLMVNAPTAANPIQNLMRGFSASLSKITKKTARDNYEAIVRRYLPANAKLIVPRYPANSNMIQWADLDGDQQNEMIASYALNDETRTIILKKNNEQWYKAAEFGSPEDGSLNYRGVADITGMGKKHLLLGMKSKGKTPSLYGYSFENGSIHQVFNRNYHKFEVLKPAHRSDTPGKAHLAFWNRTEDNHYHIDVLHWNGAQLESIENSKSYFSKKVVPYHVQRIKQMPHTPLNWYNLADSLVYAGNYKDARIAIDVGMELDRKGDFKEKFSALKNRIK